MKNKKVTIVIITFGALKYIKACIDSVNKFTPPIYKIVIIDNNSDAKTKKYLRELAKNSDNTVVFNEKNLGYGVANNQALKYVDTPYLCLLNSDTVVSPKWLENLLNPFEKHNKLAITIPISNCTTATDLQTGEKLSSKWDTFKIYFSYYPVMKSLDIFYKNYHAYTKKVSSKKSELKYIEIPEWAGTWCVIIKTDLIKKIGGLFDEQFKVGYCEDVDLSWRFFQKGYKIAEVQNSFVHHYGNASFDESAFDKFLLNRENMARLIIKYEKELEEFIKKATDNNKYKLALLATKQPMVKGFAKFQVNKKEILKMKKEGNL